MKQTIYAPIHLARKLKKAGWNKKTVCEWVKMNGKYYIHHLNSKLHAEMLKQIAKNYLYSANIIKCSPKELNYGNYRLYWGKAIVASDVLHNVFDVKDTPISDFNYIFEGYDLDDCLPAPTLGEIELPETITIKRTNNDFSVVSEIYNENLEISKYFLHNNKFQTELEARCYAWLWANKKEVQDAN